MKRMWMFVLATTALLAVTPELSLAAFDVGFVGTDDLVVTQSQALPLPADGVLKYRNVTIASGSTLTFTKNEKNTPVTILASGDILIAGTIDVSGTSAGLQLINGKGGPGGFDGGLGGWFKQDGGRGQGPGAGAGGALRADQTYGAGNGGGGGSVSDGGVGGYYTATYSAPAGSGGQAYGNARMLPFIGGSGGGGGGGTTNYQGGAGGGGGGALMLAASGTINITGAIRANGGGGSPGAGTTTISMSGNNYNYKSSGGGGGGAAGAIRLVATTLAGNGPIEANGSNGGTGCGRNGGNGSVGRIRLEMWNSLRTVVTTPNADVVWYPYALEPPNFPDLAITAVGGMVVPAITKGDYRSADISLPPATQSPVTVIVAASNIPTGTTVSVQSHPEFGNNIKSATGTLSGTESASTAAVQLEIPTGYVALLTVSATYQATTAFLGAPIFSEGEKVVQIRVDSQLGGGSLVTYITESGREIPATM